MYNRLVRMRNRVENAWAQVDVQLRRRYDLIPNLVETVKGYAAHERGTFDEVTQARTAAQQAQGVGAGRGRERPHGGARTAVRGRRGIPAAACDRELPAAPGAAGRRRAEDRRLAPGLQRHRADVRQRARDRADEHRRRPLQLQPARVLRDGRRHAGGAGRAVLSCAALRALVALVAAAALVLLGRAAAAAKSFSLPARRRRADPAGRVAPRSGADHIRLLGSSAARIATSRCGPASRSTTSPSARGRRSTGPGGAPSSAASACRTPSASTRSTTGADRLALPRERRAATFLVRYRFRGLAVAYDDVVDVNLRVWGDEWPGGLGTLTRDARRPPGPVPRALGQPGVGARASSRSPASARSCTPRVPAHQFVEFRASFPRRLTSTAGAQVAPGNGLPEIVAEEVPRSARTSTTASGSTTPRAIPGARCSTCCCSASARRSLIVARLAGLRPRAETGYDREYEQEPPTDTEPALVPSLVRQAASAGSNEFTATLFDLIRRGRYKSTPVTTERTIWGGLRHEDVADLQLSLGDTTSS